MGEGNTGGRMRSVAVARELGILAGDVESARLVLGRVGSRLEQQYNEPLAGAIECLATIHAELVAQCQQLSHNAGSWGLDPNWLPIALAVASRRQPVLITIAVNAIRSLTH